jgi:membrane protease YdiL (CAAX protease family)
MSMMTKQPWVSLTFLLIGMMMFMVVPMMPFAWPAQVVLTGIVMCLLLLSLSWFFIKREKLTLNEVNLRPDCHTPARLALGFAIGALLTGIMLTVLFNLTIVDFAPVTSQSPMPFLISSLVIIPLALMEELLFRGYAFFRSLKAVNVRIVILATALLFGLYHYNDQTTVINVLLGPGIWGVVYGVSAYISGGLAVPLGIHIAANFMQGIFGMNQYVDSLWMIHLVETEKAMLGIEVLGTSMQIVLLLVSVLVLEIYERSMKGASA